MARPALALLLAATAGVAPARRYNGGAAGSAADAMRLAGLAGVGSRGQREDAVPSADDGGLRLGAFAPAAAGPPKLMDDGPGSGSVLGERRRSRAGATAAWAAGRRQGGTPDLDEFNGGAEESLLQASSSSASMLARAEQRSSFPVQNAVAQAATAALLYNQPSTQSRTGALAAMKVPGPTKIDTIDWEIPRSWVVPGRREERVSLSPAETIKSARKARQAAKGKLAKMKSTVARFMKKVSPGRLFDDGRGLSYKWTVDKLGFNVRAEVPRDWARRLNERKLRLVHASLDSEVYTLPLLDDPKLEVAIKHAGNQGEAHIRNEINMLQRLKFSSHVPQYLGSHEYPHETYMLMEAAEGNLHSVLWGESDYDAGFRFASTMLADEALPILIDLLRAINDLEKEGIVHGDIHEENVLMAKGRALLSDFGMARVVRKDDLGLGTGAGLGETLHFQSPYRFPPETIRGSPTGPSNNVWQVGALFAVMTLGYNPMEMAAWRIDPQLSRDDLAPEVEDRIQQITRESFDIEADFGFRAMEDTDIRRLLKGMLATSVEDRWTAAQTLAYAEKIADSRGILTWPQERKWKDYGESWGGDWQ